MIEKMELDTDEDGYYLLIAGDFVEECERYINDVLETQLRLRLDATEMIRFSKQVQQTDDYYWLAHRIKP